MLRHANYELMGPKSLGKCFVNIKIDLILPMDFAGIVMKM